MELALSHPSIRFANDTREICLPLFESTPINYFVYIRISKDNKLLCLPSNEAWHIQYFKKEYYKKIHFRKTPGMYLWSSNQHFSEALLDSVKNFGIDNKFEIVEENGDDVEIYGWGSKVGHNEAINFYLNNLQLLRQFIFYFKDKAKLLIEESSKNENLINIDEKQPNEIRSSISINNTNKTRKYLASHTRHYHIGKSSDGKNEYLTQREFECLLLTIKGASSGEASELLRISDKTVRTNMENIRLKFECSSRFELLKKALRRGFCQLVW